MAAAKNTSEPPPPLALPTPYLNSRYPTLPPAAFATNVCMYEYVCAAHNMCVQHTKQTYTHTFESKCCATTFINTFCSPRLYMYM